MHELSDWDWWIITITAAPNDVSNSAPEGRKSFPQCLNIAFAVVMAQNKGFKYKKNPLLLSCKFSTIINLIYSQMSWITRVDHRTTNEVPWSQIQRQRRGGRKKKNNLGWGWPFVLVVPASTFTLSLLISPSFSVTTWPRSNRSYI